MKLTQETFGIYRCRGWPAVGLGGDLSRRIDSLSVGQVEVCEQLARVESRLIIPAETDTWVAAALTH